MSCKFNSEPTFIVTLLSTLDSESPLTANVARPTNDSTVFLLGMHDIEALNHMSEGEILSSSPNLGFERDGYSGTSVTFALPIEDCLRKKRCGIGVSFIGKKKDSLG